MQQPGSASVKHGIHDGWNHYLERRLNAFPIYIKRSDSGHVWALPRHRQPGIEINITHAGRAQLAVNRHLYVQSDRLIAAFPGSCAHELAVDPTLPYSRTVVCIDESLFQALLAARDIHRGSTAMEAIRRDYFEFTLVRELWPQIEAQCVRLDRTFRELGPWWEHIVVAQTSELIATLFSSVQGFMRASPATIANGWPEQVRRYVDRNLDQPLSLTGVARAFFVSPEHLTRTFKKLFGSTFMGYVQNRRIEAACDALADPARPIVEIAEAVGFGSRSHFHRVFKEATGLTPSEYRERTFGTTKETTDHGSFV